MVYVMFYGVDYFDKEHQIANFGVGGAVTPLKRDGEWQTASNWNK